MRVEIDDIATSFEFSSEDFKCKSIYNFYKLVKVLLNDEQHKAFYMVDTKRIFSITKERKKAFVSLFKELQQ